MRARVQNSPDIVILNTLNCILIVHAVNCKIIFSVQYYCLECCDKIDVALKWTSLSGRYTKMTKTHNGKAVYEHSGDRYCIFFGGHWKIEACDWMEKGDNSQGLAFTKVLDEVCPGRIGLEWRYYNWGVGGMYEIRQTHKV